MFPSVYTSCFLHHPMHDRLPTAIAADPLILSSDNLPLIRDRLLLSSHLYVSLVLFRPGTFAWLLKSSNDYLKHPATISIATSSSAFVLG